MSDEIPSLDLDEVRARVAALKAEFPDLRFKSAIEQYPPKVQRLSPWLTPAWIPRPNLGHY